ncbi:MAG: hypothetical protein ACYC1M_05215 [Armatimonadota bacterium]
MAQNEDIGIILNFGWSTAYYADVLMRFYWGDRMIKRSVMKKGRRYFAPDNEDAGEYAIPAEGCRVIGVGVALTRDKGGL